MLGHITWHCVCCMDQSSQKRMLRMTYCEPGSAYISLIAYFLRAKRRVNIHTFCKSCLEKEQPSLVEEIDTIQKKRLQSEFNERLPWTKKEWHFWVTTEECQKWNETFGYRGNVRLHLRVEAKMN